MQGASPPRIKHPFQANALSTPNPDISWGWGVLAPFSPDTGAGGAPAPTDSVFFDLVGG
jgi:hypothetical protein